MHADDVIAATNRPAALRCFDLDVDYAGERGVNHAVLKNVALNVADGEVVALLGASGSGKSTLMNAVAGLVQPSRGEIWVAGKRVADAARSLPPEQRAVGMSFQNFALWPHLPVLETVAYPLRRQGRSARDAAAAATAILAQLEIDDLARRRPAELSGGEQQRVGLARALARDARLYLLDEPTAHLDAHVRSAFQQSIVARRETTGAAVVYATHDAAEALALADRVAMMVDGAVIQIGSPTEVYNEPVSVEAAALAGPCSELGPAMAGSPGAQVIVRPDWVHLGGESTGRVRIVAFRGAYTDYQLETRAGALLMTLPGPPRLAPGDPVNWGLSRVWVIDPGTASSADELTDRLSRAQ